MSNRQDKPTSSPQPNPAMQAMGAVFAKMSERETGMAKTYYRDVSKKALLKANEEKMG